MPAWRTPRGGGSSTAAALSCVACVACMAACSEESARAHATVIRDAAVDTRPPVETPPCEPTLPSIQANVFAVACGFEYCHGASAAAGLWLLGPEAERDLVRGRSVDCPPWLLVDPGFPEKSLLFQKVYSDHPPCRTERMPFGEGRLTPPAIECIRDWIAGLGDGPNDAAIVTSE